jgi:SAM-dependent methyltransferase
MILTFAGPTAQQVWSNLLYSVQTGEPAFGHVFGVDPFEFFAQHPEEHMVFNQAMAEASAGIAKSVLESYDFSDFHTVVDVGGGFGVLLARILERHPSSRGILVEQPAVAEGAKHVLARMGVAERCEIVGCDFFDEIPHAGDVYILKSVLHSWPDSGCARILENCHRAMSRGGRILVIEILVPPRIDTSLLSQVAAERDVNILVSMGGRQRTSDEFQDLLDSAGFRNPRLIPTGALTSIVEATK